MVKAGAQSGNQRRILKKVTTGGVKQISEMVGYCGQASGMKER